jgi:hypothetical protein
VDGYEASGVSSYICKAVANSENAAYQDGGITCTATTCSRPNPPVNAVIVGASCPANGRHEPAQRATCDLACDSGFQASGMTPYTCLPVSGSAQAQYQNGAITCTQIFTCSCSGGNGATGAGPGFTPTCTTCTSCHPGYFPSGSSCFVNTCTCTGGNAVQGTSCSSNGGEQCANCGDGKYLTSAKKCATKECTCSFGPGATSTLCPTHGTPYCASCNAGMYLVNGVCRGCKICPAGNRVRQQCTASTDTVCECDRGYAGVYGCTACLGKNFAGDYGQSSCSTCPDGANGFSSGSPTANDGCQVDTCSRPAPPANAVIVESSCPAVGTQTPQSTCAVSCVDGYKPSGMTPYKCVPISGTVRAEYKNGAITCTASTCQRPTLPANAAFVEASCPVTGIQGESTCQLACVDGYKSSDLAVYNCLAVSGSADAAYQNGGITCTASTCPLPSLPPNAAFVNSAICIDEGIQHQSTCNMECEDEHTTSDNTPYNCLPVSGSSEAAYQNGGITCTAMDPCKVTLSEHWDESVQPDFTGETKTLTGKGDFPLGDFRGASSVSVTGTGCVAYGFATEDCSGEQGTAVTEGVHSGSDDLGHSEKWGCNDCVRCVRIDRINDNA